MIRIRTFSMKKNTIFYIYSIKEKIDINPPYQRHGGLWDIPRKQLFLDSIFNGFDIPKLYFHELDKPKIPKKTKNKLVSYAIIDGRQRLETLWEFIENKYPLGDNVIDRLKEPINLNGYFYKDLAQKYPSLKSFLNAYELPIVCVKLSENYDDALIGEMFLRLNEGVVLTAPEKRNSMGGKMVKLIRKMAFHDFFIDRVTIPNIRYQHYEVAVRLLFLENSIRKGTIEDTKKKLLDKFAKDHKEKSPEPGTTEMVYEVLDSMARIFSSKDSLLKRQARIPIYYLLTREAKKQNKRKTFSAYLILIS